MDRVKVTDGVELSRIVYGMWRLDEGDTSPDHVRAKIEACLAQGITTIDLADIYGSYEAEAHLGRALTPELRDRIEIVTKCGIVAPIGRYADRRVKHYDTSRAHIEASVDRALADLGTDRIDLLLIHRPDPMMDHRETGAALDAAVASGKVRAVGASNFKRQDWTLLQSAMDTPLAANQIEMSLGHTAPFTDGDLAFVQELGAVPMAWSPLGGGNLMTGRLGHGRLRTALADAAAAHDTDMAAIALAWLLAHPAGLVPVVGTGNLERIGTLSRAFDVRLDREDWFEFYALARGCDVP